MKILFIAPYLPAPPVGGGRIRVHAFIKHLARNHQVSLIAFAQDPEDRAGVSELEKIGADVVTVPLANQRLRNHKRKYQFLSLFTKRPYQYFSYFSSEMQETVNQYLRDHEVDVISVEHAFMGYYELPGHAKRVLDQHNVEHEILYRTYLNEGVSLRKLFNFVEWHKFKRDELNICRKFSMCVTTSERDRQALAAEVPSTRYAVIPNGVDSTFFENADPGMSEDSTILFTGTIDYYPNIDGLKYFIEEVLPLIRREIPEVKFYIVGKNPPPSIRQYEAEPGIIVTGYVDDTRDYFKRATVVVAPLRVGGGTRLKILEAMAMRKPVVATSVGAEGLEVRDGRNILVADEPTALSQVVVTLLRDRPLRARLAEEGRRLVEKRYDWKVITGQLEQAYESLLVGYVPQSHLVQTTSRFWQVDTASG